MQCGVRVVSVCVVLLALGGCTPHGEQIMIQNARSAGYSQGYGDGCASGRRAAGNAEVNATKETLLYLENARYKEGWNTGYKECKFREEKIAKLPQEPRQPIRF